MEKPSKLNLIDETAIPGRVKKKHAQWLELLKMIPQGKAYAVTEADLGVKAISVKTIVNRMVETGEIPKSYSVLQRTVNGKITVYIVNSAKEANE